MRKKYTLALYIRYLLELCLVNTFSSVELLSKIQKNQENSHKILYWAYMEN